MTYKTVNPQEMQLGHNEQQAIPAVYVLGEWTCSLGSIGLSCVNGWSGTFFKKIALLTTVDMDLLWLPSYKGKYIFLEPVP
jgi:hypothetical protein